MINLLFKPKDELAIQAISLSNRNVNDKIIWHFNKEMIFSVKSAYKVAIEVEVPNLGEAVPDVWMKLWNLRIPPKIKYFIWRICHDCLPPRSRLSQKGVEVYNCCIFCITSGKIRKQLFLDCDFVTDVLSWIWSLFFQFSSTIRWGVVVKVGCVCMGDLESKECVDLEWVCV
jgi:hypothetical protein